MLLSSCHLPPLFVDFGHLVRWGGPVAKYLDARTNTNTYLASNPPTAQATSPHCPPLTGRGGDRVAWKRIAPHRIAPHRIASHRIGCFLFFFCLYTWHDGLRKGVGISGNAYR
ncbi:hypothetical protein LX36DRAFT_490067 [Colletotrichum falcatum]|nr:hypothetical protein LX36DRAFT_490067 [Colletotrichum falcatum]